MDYGVWNLYNEQAIENKKKKISQIKIHVFRNNTWDEISLVFTANNASFIIFLVIIYDDVIYAAIKSLKINVLVRILKFILGFHRKFFENVFFLVIINYSGKRYSKLI